MHLQSIKISPDVNEISENIDVMNKDKSQMILESVRLLSSNSNKQRYSKRMKSNASIRSLYAVI
jgi:hypothetical protein